MSRRITCIAVALAVLLSLCGCSRLTDVRLRLVIHAIGIDLVEDGIYAVSYQAFKATPSGGGPVDATEQNVITMVTYGRTLYETKQSLERQTGKEVFMGDTELIVIGKDLAGQDIKGVLQYFWESADIYMGVNVVFSDIKASEMVGVTLEHGTAITELLCEMVNMAVKDGAAVPAKLITVSNKLSEKDSAFLMPVLTSKQADYSEGAKDTSIYDKSVGVFKNALVIDGKPLYYVTSDEARGVNLLTGDIGDITLTVMYDDIPVAVKASISRVGRRVEIGENGYPKIKVSIFGDMTIEDAPENAEPERVAKLCRLEILRLCRLGYEKTAAMYGADVLEIGRLLKKFQSEYYRRHENELKSVVQSTSFEVSVNLKELGNRTRSG